MLGQTTNKGGRTLKHTRAVMRKGGAWWDTFAGAAALSAIVGTLARQWMKADTEAKVSEYERGYAPQRIEYYKAMATKRLQEEGRRESLRDTENLYHQILQMEDAFVETPLEHPTGLAPGAVEASKEAEGLLRTLTTRYPAVFGAHPEYQNMLLDQLVAAIQSPLDPSDPLYVQKVLGSLEYQLALEQARLQPIPTVATSTISRPDVLAPAKSLAEWQRSQLAHQGTEGSQYGYAARRKK